MTFHFVSNSEKDTLCFASKIAKNLRQGDILILSGALGAGKTKFTEGILTYFGLQNDISSPTFTIVNEYQKDVTPIFHFDLYRLSDLDEFYAIGGEEYLDRGISIFEWGELIEPILKDKSYLKITFIQDYTLESKRLLTIETFGKAENLLEGTGISNWNYLAFLLLASAALQHC